LVGKQSVLVDRVVVRHSVDDGCFGDVERTGGGEHHRLRRECVTGDLSDDVLDQRILAGTSAEM
jgi:hypothetical protein